MNRIVRITSAFITGIIFIQIMSVIQESSDKIEFGEITQTLIRLSPTLFWVIMEIVIILKDIIKDLNKRKSTSIKQEVQK